MLILCSGCQANDNEMSLSDRLPLTFVTQVDEAKTRGLDPITNLTLGSIGIFAGHTPNDELFNINLLQATSSMNNVLFTKDEHGTWVGNPKQYWPLGGTLSFFAYAPYDAAVVPTNDYTNGWLKLLFSPQR